MDGAKALDLSLATDAGFQTLVPVCRRCVLIAIKPLARAGVKLSTVQISVVVADIQTSYLFQGGRDSFSILDSKALKVVVGKVFLRVALMQKLVGPKCPEKSNKKYVMKDTKGNWVDIPKLRIIARL